MITSIFIPTTKFKNDFEVKKDIDQETYIKMLNDNYDESSFDIVNFIENGVKSNKKYTFYQKLDDTYDDNDYYEYNEVKALITDINDNDLKASNILSYYESDEILVLILSINVETLNEDTESEIRSWIKDSMNINNNTNINDDLKILNLPKKNIKIDINNNILYMVNCKILDNYSDISHGKIKFAILIEKITNKL